MESSTSYEPLASSLGQSGLRKCASTMSASPTFFLGPFGDHRAQQGAPQQQDPGQNLAVLVSRTSALMQADMMMSGDIRQLRDAVGKMEDTLQRILSKDVVGSEQMRELTDRLERCESDLGGGNPRHAQSLQKQLNSQREEMLRMEESLNGLLDKRGEALDKKINILADHMKVADPWIEKPVVEPFSRNEFEEEVVSLEDHFVGMLEAHRLQVRTAFEVMAERIEARFLQAFHRFEETGAHTYAHTDAPSDLGADELLDKDPMKPMDAMLRQISHNSQATWRSEYNNGDQAARVRNSLAATRSERRGSSQTSSSVLEAVNQLQESVSRRASIDAMPISEPIETKGSRAGTCSAYEIIGDLKDVISDGLPSAQSSSEVAGSQWFLHSTAESIPEPRASSYSASTPAPVDDSLGKLEAFLAFRRGSPLQPSHGDPVDVVLDNSDDQRFGSYTARGTPSSNYLIDGVAAPGKEEQLEKLTVEKPPYRQQLTDDESDEESQAPRVGSSMEKCLHADSLQQQHTTHDRRRNEGLQSRESAAQRQGGSSRRAFSPEKRGLLEADA